jgi:hypothetical protein
VIVSKAAVRFEVIRAVSTKMAVFWVVAPCSLVSEVLAASIIRATEAARTIFRAM